MEERYPGELDALRAENVRLRRLLDLSAEQAGAADPDQAALASIPVPAPVDMGSQPDEKVAFYASLFGCRTDIYAVRWENRRDGRSGWMPVVEGRWRKGMKREDAPYLPLTATVVDEHLRGAITSGCIRCSTTTPAGGLPRISTRIPPCSMHWRS